MPAASLAMFSRNNIEFFSSAIEWNILLGAVYALLSKLLSNFSFFKLYFFFIWYRYNINNIGIINYFVFMYCENYQKLLTLITQQVNWMRFYGV